ncbi:MAG TPA: tetratricopeptide repeat protein [Chloroflexota bacterium]|nr:tetratricopeptide repeat protein [Chloroflexota bacterium]
MGKKNRAPHPTAQADRPSQESAGLLRFIQQLMRERKFPEAIRAAQTLIETDPLNPTSHAVMGSLLLQLNQAEDAVRRFDMAARFGMDRDPELLRGLAVANTMAGYTIHGAQSARACLQIATAEDQRRICETIVSAGESMIRELIGKHPVSPEDGERALLLIEQSTRAMRAEDDERALLRATEATKAAPAWPFVWNNLAIMRFGENDLPGAIEACEEGNRLAQTPDPMITLSLARIFSAHGRQAEAEALVEAMIADPEAQGADAGDLGRGLALIGRDQEAFDQLYPAFQAGESLSHGARYVLGAAAANLGKPDITRAAWRNLAREGMPQVRGFSDIVGRQEEPPTLDGRFPYLNAIELVPRVLLETIFTEGQTDPSQVELASFAAQFPRLPEALCEPLLTASVNARLTAELLLCLPTPAVGAVTRFAVSRNLTDYERLYAHITLRGRGFIKAADPASVWISGRRHEWLLPSIRLVKPPAPGFSEQVNTLLTEGHKAQEANDPARAAEIYGRVLELEPDTREAEHNLGTALMLSNRMEEGEQHVRRSLELDGDYVLARANLGALELARQNLAAAHDLLDPLDRQTDFSLEDVIAYLRARADLAMADGDPAKAAVLFHCLLAFDPENRLARERLTALARFTPAPVG